MNQKTTVPTTKDCSSVASYCTSQGSQLLSKSYCCVSSLQKGEIREQIQPAKKKSYEIVFVALNLLLPAAGAWQGRH
jgi:hypothetical protein